MAYVSERKYQQYLRNVKKYDFTVIVKTYRSKVFDVAQGSKSVMLHKISYNMNAGIESM